MDKIRIGGHLFDYPQNLIMLKADANYTKICCKNGKEVVVATTLGILEERLKYYGFFRLSRNTLVNLDAVLGYKWEGQFLIASLVTHEDIKVSRRRENHFLSIAG